MPPKKPAFDFKTSVKTPSGYDFQVSLKIMDKLTAVGAIVGGVACGAAAVVCGVMYWIQTNPDLVKEAVKAALEAVGVEVKNVAPGSILVEVLCTSKESFLLFMDDFETNKIKQRLEEEFQNKLNFEGELEVKIINEQEVYADLDHLRRFEEVEGHISVETEVDVSGIPITGAVPIAEEISRQRQIKEEFVHVPKHLKGYVIGMSGREAKKIQQISGAKVVAKPKDEEGFIVTGNEEQRECAKKVISQKLGHVEEGIVTQRVQVTKELKGRVIGSRGCVIKEIMSMSGAVISSGGKEDEWFEVYGDAVQRERAKKLILEKVRHLEERMVTERVQVSKDLKGRVIGSGGCVIKEIMRMSGAQISSTRKEDEWFEVYGGTAQREHAKKLILEKVNEPVQQRMREGGALQADLIEVPDQYKGLVIGKGGDNLRNISTQTGAKVTSRDNELYIVSGTNEQRQLAKIHIKLTVNSARLKGVENEFNKAYRYVDDWNLPEDCRLKLEPLTQEDRMFLRGPHAQYRLRPAEAYEQQDSSRPRDEPSYLLKLKEAALESLRQIKHEMETKDNLMLDMWCHFGLGIIRGPDEEEADEEWTIDEANEKFQPSSEGNCWRTAFNQGVDVNEKIFDDYPCQKSSEEYVARYDLTFLTPCAHELRCKVWVAKQTVEKTLEDLEVPFSDVKNILEEIHFEDKATRSRCRGWLVLPSRKYLQADILFPGCEFDCRLTIRGRTESGLVLDYLPHEDVRRTLSRYLSELTVTKEDGSGLHLPKTNEPEGFHLIHKRYSRRSLYEISEGFKIILSRESTWRSVGTAAGETRESTDLHIHCEEWDMLLGSGVWEPEAIVRKMPEFLAFVKEVQCFVVSKESGLASAVPPEILARGSLAVNAYNKALADGKTSVKRVPIMLVGQDRAGKTSLKKSLKGICFDSKEDSTIGIDVDPSHFKVTTETWRTGTKRDQNADEEISFDHHAAMWIVDNMEKRNESFLFENSSDFDVSVIPKQPGPAGEKTDKAAEVQMTSKPEFTISGDASQLSSRPSEQNHPRVPEAVVTVTAKLLQGGWEDNRNDIYSTVWDFAGQSVYYETHPLFLTARAIYCLVYDLSLNPRDRAKAVVKQGVYEKYEDTFNLKTNLDYLDFWMMSVASLARYQSDGQDVRPKSEVLPDKLPAVFLVCTHADKPYEDRDPLEFAREIFGCLKRKPYGAHLHDFFVVDNTKSGTESECLEVVRLRQEVLAVAKDLPHINETIPIKWLKFDQAMNALKEKGRKYISLEEAKDIASTRCNIKEEKEAKTLIDYLHDLRSLIHFDDSPELNKLVVLDPQWLIDVFKKVITVRPYDCKEKKLVDKWCKLEKEGILDEELLTHVWGNLCSNNESRASFVRIMEKFSLLCPWPSETSKSFIVPSMLKTHPQDEMFDMVARATIPSLFIKFATDQVPPGLFHRFVLQFFQWGKENFLRSKPQLFKNLARFLTSRDEACSVIFAWRTSSIEVVILAGEHHDFAAFTCAGDVSRQVSLMLESMRHEFHWLSSVKYEMSVLCPVCCKGGAIDYCRSHGVKRCNEEQCLHFWSLSGLKSAKTVVCELAHFAENRNVYADDFAPWFGTSEEQLTVAERDRIRLFPGEGHEEKALALLKNVLESLCCLSNESKEVVAQFTESLQLEQASLEEPNSGTKALIRSFSRIAVRLKRPDVVKHLREKLPAGTTGPLLPEHLVVQNIPLQQLEDLTHILSGGDEWKRVAEKLGLTPDKIRYLDKRVMNPADAFLAYLAKRRHFTVAELYDVLCECGFPVLADKL